MKTSEFIKRVEGLGYRTCENAAWLDVIAFNHHIPEVQVNTAIDAIRVNTTNKELMKLCIEYAETPISEREEEKKYYVILPDPRNDGTRCQALYKGLYGIFIGYVYRRDLQGFTEAEIKRNHEYLWQFAKEVVE